MQIKCPTEIYVKCRKSPKSRESDKSACVRIGEHEVVLCRACNYASDKQEVRNDVDYKFRECDIQRRLETCHCRRMSRERSVRLRTRYVFPTFSRCPVYLRA